MVTKKKASTPKETEKAVNPFTQPKAAPKPDPRVKRVAKKERELPTNRRPKVVKSQAK